MPVGQDLFSPPALKSCFRCGGEFRTSCDERVCASCRIRRERKVSKVSSIQELTLREKQVVELVQLAKLNKEIAHELHLTEGTVKEYLNRIFRKLGVTNRTQLAVLAVRQMNAA
jgi:DNA-binding NarL/FixJ family response regulator